MTIAGRPLLWLPIEANLPAGVHSPKQYGRKLVSVNIAGKPPLLFDASTGCADRCSSAFVPSISGSGLI